MTSNDYVAMMRSAKGKLANKWLYAVIGTLIFLAILSVASFTYIAELIIYGPLMFGYILFLMCLCDTGRENYNLLFKGFDRFAQTLVAGLLYSLAVGIGFALLIVPGIILLCGFSMTFFIMCDDENISGIDALQQSWNMMQGHKMEFFMLQLRFIGWYILALLTCGIGFLWLYPYVTLASFNFYRQVRFGSF